MSKWPKYYGMICEKKWPKCYKPFFPQSMSNNGKKKIVFTNPNNMNCDMKMHNIEYNRVH